MALLTRTRGVCFGDLSVQYKYPFIASALPNVTSTRPASVTAYRSGALSPLVNIFDPSTTMKSVLTASFVLFGIASAASLPGKPSYRAPEGYKFDSAKKRACSEAEVALATGIHLNINGQYGEYNSTQKSVYF